MKIVNIDANENSCRKVVGMQAFILDVFASLNSKMEYHSHHQIECRCHCKIATSLPLSPIRKYYEEGYENVANLLHTIPIYLRDVHPDKFEEDDIVDLLGAYYPNRQNDNPYIEMYVRNIENESKSDMVRFKWLFTKVLIHELAHAALDIFNCENNHITIEKVRYNSQFGKWREESMANAVALKVIKEYGDQDFYNYAKDFMNNQTKEYKLGIFMEDFGFWDFRSVMEGKQNGVNAKLQNAWLDYVDGKTPVVWSELKRWNEILTSNIIFIYKGKYYTDHQNLVLDIVHDFINTQSSKISFSQLCSAFPNVKVQSKVAYQLLSQVQNDSQYYTDPNQVLHLSDGDYALYKYWYNDELDYFLEMANKNGFTIERFK